jgi:hypothetical protein
MLDATVTQRLLACATSSHPYALLQVAAHDEVVGTARDYRAAPSTERVLACARVLPHPAPEPSANNVLGLALRAIVFAAFLLAWWFAVGQPLTEALSE